MFVPMFNLSICYLFMLLIQTITSTSSCIYDVGNGQKLDIRPLGIANGKGPKYDNIPNSGSVPYTFSWNACFDYSKSDSSSCKDAAACYTNRNSGQSTLIAKQSDAEFEHQDALNNLLIYNHDNLLLTVHLICAPGAERILGDQESSDIFNIRVYSQCCCPGKCGYSSDSISGGAIFVIILVAILFVYIVGGIIFLKFSRGATGPDIIPNRLMWLSILSHAMDGLRYSVQVIRHRSFSVDYQKI